MKLSQNQISSFIKTIQDSRNIISEIYSPYIQDTIDIFKKGNKIKIKKKNRGKFTEYRNGKDTSECIQRGKNSPDPKIRKRATFAANSRKWKHQHGGVLSQEDKDILWLFNEDFGANSSKDKYFKYWDFQKGSPEINDYFNSYLKSSGIKRILNNQDKWWKSRHPYRKWYSNSDRGTKEWLDMAYKANPYFYTVDMYTDQSSVRTLPSLPRIITVGRRESVDNNFPYNFTVGHEYAHGKSPYTIFGNVGFRNESAQAEVLNQNTKTETGHDSHQDEKHADNWGLKYLLYKEGIYDARSNKDITIEQVKKLRKLYPNLRPFKQMTDKEIQFQINNVAYNEINEINKENNLV